MARRRWVDRLPGSWGSGAPQAPHRSDAERLLGVLRNDPAAAVLQPVVRAMSRDVTSWIMAHPGASAAVDLELLRLALRSAPDAQDLLAARVAGIHRILEAAASQGVALPPLMLMLSVPVLSDQGMAYLLNALPPGSAVRVDAQVAAAQPELARTVATRLHRLGVRCALGGLVAANSEVDLVRLVNPDVLVLDVRPPLDYKDRSASISRLREAAPQADVLVCGVATPLDEWAAVNCGATHLTGSYYDDEDLLTLVTGGSRLQAFAEETECSAFEIAAARHPPAEESLGALRIRADSIRDLVCARGPAADVYLLFNTPLETREPTAEAVHAMVDAGAAVTVGSVGLSGPLTRDVSWGDVPENDPLAKSWALVALLPGEGHVLTGHPVGAEVGVFAQVHAFVHAQDRDLALRIAARISRLVAKRPVAPSE